MSSIFDEIYSTDDNGVRHYKILLNGNWSTPDSAPHMEVSQPHNGEIFAYVPECTVDDVSTAVISARTHFSEYKQYTSLQRMEILEKAEHILKENADTVAQIISKESGKPITISESEVKATCERLKLTLQEVRVLYGEYLPGEWVEDTKNKFAIVLRKPLGVVAAISSFNYPLFIAAAKIIPAIVAGNTVIAKPASDTPLTLLYFARILEAAGLPAGALNIITGRGRAIGDALVEHEDVDAVTFTGSTRVGESIARKAGIKKLHLELGGKAAAIVLEDADLANAAAQICRGTFRNSGQRCDAVSRVLVHKNVKAQLVEKIIAETSKYPLGDPFDRATAVGPVINAKAIERIDRLVKNAVDAGAKVLAGGKANGLFFEPTVLSDVTTEMDIAWEEIFGPVMPIIEVSSAEEAIEISNSSEFGLDSCIFTENINSALKYSYLLEDGSVTINAMPAHGVGHFPFGGNKKSGLGREGLKYSIDELTKLHTIVINQK